MPVIISFEAVRKALLPLLQSLNYTKTSALHSLRFTSRLDVWKNLSEAVEEVDHAQHRSARTIDLKLANRQIHEERVECGNEATGLNMQLGDFRTIPSTYNNEPDFIMKSDNSLLCVAEVKTWWVADHEITFAMENENLFRKIVAQAIQYVQHSSCQYGCLTNGRRNVFDVLLCTDDGCSFELGHDDPGMAG
ncbi:hypothetical protein DTO006G1_8832 [Penicillium roqueforti]|uniref:uncharacterized protein n=1 Tax=Penicillium roqueforti TaxID=5082 RepID=UPI00190C8733|nr:uncharacterized protein LCP9604111_1265 [Penicillium roqueforti]KAF9253739.1 hypothetical protein LCP9604111_1265 [Penicillium roqueforti]KAI1835372.1 hypothetical protein CBS147337_3395 [Penicillium roqueforti]KAI2686247.1 hypothetical protein CBS147355_1734 [Penicillium roqueforti]KAI2687389.1 hypothetical protein LCP963914a_3990 [Penicillium roqueforti]KAI2706250.1 hypothetical protein CBS147372_161 [Penicillium roqueforti]